MGRRFGSLWFGIGALAIVCLGGCGENGRPKTIPVTGRLTIDGHEPGEFGKLFFTPTLVAEGYNKRPASGSFNSDGSFSAMSWAPNDGLVPGHYTIKIMPADLAMTKIPKRYQDSSTSGLEVDVPVDQGKIDHNIDLLSK